MVDKLKQLSNKLIEKTESGALSWRHHVVEGYEGTYGYEADDGMGHIFEIDPGGAVYVVDKATDRVFRAGNSEDLYNVAHEQFEKGVAALKRKEHEVPYIDKVLDALSKL